MTTDLQLRNRSHSKLGNHNILGKTAFNLSKYIYENFKKGNGNYFLLGDYAINQAHNASDSLTLFIMNS